MRDLVNYPMTKILFFLTFLLEYNCFTTLCKVSAIQQNESAICIWRRQWHPAPVFLPGKSHGWRSLVGCSPWGRQESDTTEQLHFDFSLSCIGEGNGNPLQCSCLENPRGGAAWWAAVYGVAQGRPRLKLLSSNRSTYGASQGALVVKNSLPMQEMPVLSVQGKLIKTLRRS